MALLPLDNFLCWKLKIAVLAICVYAVIAAAIAALLELLDVIAFASPDFEIAGGFNSHWRAHVWEGWLACNLVMFITHLIVIIYSIVMIFAIKRFPTYYEYNLTKWYLLLFVCYFLIEFGTSLYKYSWYGENTFRKGYLIFTFLYWLIRAIISVIAIIVILSRIMEVSYEIKYGEKRDLSKWASRANLLDATRSGVATPTARGYPSIVSQSYA